MPFETERELLSFFVGLLVVAKALRFEFGPFSCLFELMASYWIFDLFGIRVEWLVLGLFLNFSFLFLRGKDGFCVDHDYVAYVIVILCSLLFPFFSSWTVLSSSEVFILVSFFLVKLMIFFWYFFLFVWGRQVKVVSSSVKWAYVTVCLILCSKCVAMTFGVVRGLVMVGFTILF